MLEFLSAFLRALTPGVLIWIVVGVIAGVAVGSIPGLTATMTVAVLIPFTFGMDPLSGISMLLGIYIGALYGGSISACLVRIPGTPSAVMTARDSYPMARKGEAGKALAYSAYASFMGSIFGVIVLIVLAQAISRISLKFGPAEMFAVAVWGLASISDLTGEDLVKGIISALIGLLIGTIGVDPVTGIPRLTFGQIALLNGIDFIPIMIGLFGISEVLRQARAARLSEEVPKKVGDIRLSLREMIKVLPTIIRASFIGMWVGVLPGATGGAMASVMAYEYEQKRDRDPKRFGTGVPEGICASEAANNASIGGNLVPLLTLGVPGDTVTAMLIGAFMIHGLQPGPMLFKNSADLVYAIYASLLIASAIMFIIGLYGARYFARIISFPLNRLIPAIALLCLTGTYAVNGNMFDIAVMILFGLIGYFMEARNIPLPPMIMGIVLGPMAEFNLRTALKTFHNDWTVFFTRPYVVFFWVLIVLMVLGPRVNWKKLLGIFQKNKERAVNP
ncbi:MAG: tripartite tricarboxylate transporter permease [Thermanaeromonas sp.]|uniref:tripartite tricarboxylate transporter permease n=1 Tax=Thermanaeromonas sp. TaxID=2003697 RepID=UPI00243CD2E1|nr:tripartite tricarboxylate transporter permease [Thermanaeromonas sp.]MCG0278743.1 tripartite tricarboxylate transporter permease [Thermanaeromonas sp.]